MALPNPLPQTLREAVWQALVAILFATQFKDIVGFFSRFWRLLRESSATAQVKAAEAHKTDAEAGAIEADTYISLMREMRVSMKQAEKFRETLHSELASKDSTIALLKAEIADWRMRHPDEVVKKVGPTSAA